MLFQDGLGPSLVHVLLACGQVPGETCTDSLGNVLSLQSNWNIVTISFALSVGICSWKSYHCVGAGLFLRLAFLPACVPSPGLGVHAYSKANVHFVSNFVVYQKLVVLHWFLEVAWSCKHWFWEVAWSCKESDF